MSSKTAAAEEPATYLFGRRDRGSLLLGFRAPQLVVLSIGLAATLVGLLTGGGRGGIYGACVLGAAFVAAVFPVQGRPLVDWLRPLANHGYGKATGQARYLVSAYYLM
jgi:hypothetical protein